MVKTRSKCICVSIRISLHFILLTVVCVLNDNAKLMQSERNLNPVTFHFNYWGLRVLVNAKLIANRNANLTFITFRFMYWVYIFYWVCVLAISLMPCIMETILIYHPLMPCISLQLRWVKVGCVFTIFLYCSERLPSCAGSGLNHLSSPPFALKMVAACSFKSCLI
jgi:hypothetical protein